MINSGIGNNDITLSVGFDYSKAIGQDAPRAAAELQKVFSNFGGKNRALIEPLGRISSSTTEFAKSLEAANARVIAFGASVGIIYNIQKAFTELVKSTVQVEKKLTDINVVLSTSSSQLRKFGDELFSIANDTGKSFEEVSNAAIEFSRQGLGVQETLKRTKDALILTRIAGIDTKDAVDALTAGVNSFSKSLIDSTQIVNKFAAVDAAFAVSSQDLAEALRRVGSSAQDAGVDLDELAGLVTSVQQTTARGGAVIGNALKTIFSRLSRGETIRELKDLGVQIDESQTGIEKLKALSAALQNVSGTQGAAIKEAAGGVYQINVVSAALSDLSKQYGIYEQALTKSRGATDEAISRNKELGTTLAALATTTENNLVKAFSKIGSLTIDTPFRSILKGINTTLLEPMGKLGDEGGSEFVTNFFKGIGKFIEGPGLTYITLVGANLTKALVGFAGDAFKQLQRYNKDNTQLLATQKGISLELERDQNLVLGIASGNIKVADAQSLIIQRLQQDLALREKIAAISRGIGQGVIKSGIAYSNETGTPQRIRKTFAGGLVPSPKEVFTESLGAMDGGYKPGKVKVTNVPGLGRAIYNDNETIKNFPGLAQPAIMPPQNSNAGQKYQKNFYGKHGFNPYMSGGMIPNFSLGKKHLFPDGKRSNRKIFQNKEEFREILEAFKILNIERKNNGIGIFKNDYSVYKGGANPKIGLEKASGQNKREKQLNTLFTLSHEFSHSGQLGGEKRLVKDFSEIFSKHYDRGGNWKLSLDKEYDLLAEQEAWANGQKFIPKRFIDEYKDHAKSMYLTYDKNGNIPNFASKKVIGGGFYGSFSQYAARPNLGFKSFKPGIPDDYILKELENSKVSKNLLKKNPLLTVPEVLGSPKRTLARRGYGKEFIEEGDLYSILVKLREKYPDRPDQVRGVMSSVMRLGYGEARKHGISVQDSTYDNIGSKGGLFNFASKYMDNPDNFDSFGLPKIKTAELKKELVNSGIKLSLLDLGDVKYRGQKGFASGNIPNFVKYPSHKDFLKRNTDESILKMLEAYPAKFGSYKQKYLNVDLPQGESKVRYSDPIDATEFARKLSDLEGRRGYVASKGMVPNFATFGLPKINNSEIQKRLSHAFSKGSDYKDFYSIVGGAFKDKADAIAFGGIASSLSPRVPDYVAGPASVAAFKHYKKTGSQSVDDYLNLPISGNVGNYKTIGQLGFFGPKAARRAGLSKALTGQTLARKDTDKTRHYAEALAGNEDAFPIDTNVLRAIFGETMEGTLRSKDARRLIKVARSTASGLGISARELQAGIFKGANSRFNDKYDSNYIEGLRNSLSSSNGLVPNFASPGDIISQNGVKSMVTAMGPYLALAQLPPKKDNYNNYNDGNKNNFNPNDFYSPPIRFNEQSHNDKDLSQEFLSRRKGTKSRFFKSFKDSEEFQKIYKSEGPINELRGYNAISDVKSMRKAVGTAAFDSNKLQGKGKFSEANYIKDVVLGNRKAFANLYLNFRKNRTFTPESIAKEYTYNKGLVPNFSGLAGAIKRESQSVPASTIKVGMDSRLKSTQNPTGLGVYNTIHEPNGLSQGITRAYSEGLNPKTYNVPNFADFKLESKNYGSSYLDKVLRPQLNELLGSIQKNKVSFDKLKPQIDSLIKESQLTAKSASSVRGIFRNAEINRPGTAGTMTSIQEDQRIRNLVRNGIAGFSELARPQDIDDYRERQKNIEDLGRKSFSSKLRAGIAGFSSFGRRQVRPEELSYDQMVFQDKNNSLGNLGNASRSAKIASGIRNFTQFFERLSTAPYEESRLYEQRVQDLGALGMRAGSNKIRNSISGFSRFNSFEQGSREYLASTYNRPATYDDLMGPANFNGASNVEMLQSKITSLRQKADSFNFLGSRRAIKEAESLGKSGAITKEEVDALKGLRNNRVQTAAGLGSFLVPTVLTPALQGISDNKKYQASVEAGSSVASLGLTGASVGAGFAATGVGAGIGALVGFLTTLPSLLKAINDPIPELGMRLEKLQENFIKSSSVLQQYSALTEKLSEIQSGGISGIKQKDIDRLSFERQKALNQVNPEYRTKLAELAKGGDISGLRNFEGIINQIESRKLSSGKLLEKFIETDNKKFTFSNILEKTPGPGISQIKLARDIIRNKDLVFNKDTDSSFNPYSLGLSGAVGLFGAARGINEQEIKQRLAGRRDRVDLARGAVSEISGFSNVDGQSVFELLFKDKNLQQKIGNASGLQDITKLLADLGSKNKIKGLSDYLKDLSKVSDEETKGLILKFFRNQFSEAGVDATKAGELVDAEKQKNKVIDESIKSVLEFNTSLLKLSAEFNKLNQGKLIDLETAFGLDKIKLNVKNALESLGAGDFKKVGLKYKESELDRQQKLSLGLAGLETQTNQEYLNKITDFQTTILAKGIDRLDAKKGGNYQEFKAESKQYEETLANLFESVGLNDISFDKFGKETVDSIIDSLNQNSENFSFLSEEDKRFIAKELPKLKQDIEKASLLKSVKEAQLKKEFESNGKLNTAQQKGELDALGYTNKYNLDLLRNSNVFDVGQTRVSANFEKNQQLQRLRDEFNLSNLGGGNRLNKQFDINQRNILDQYNFESGNLLPRLLQEGGKDSLQFQDATKNIKSQEDLNRLITDYSIKKAFGANKDKDSIDNLNKLLTIQEQLKSSQDKLNISKEKALETEKKTLEFQKELLKYRFQEERISDNLKNIEGKIRVGGGLSGGDIKSVVKEQFNYTPRDFQRDAILGVNEVSATIKTSFSGAISSIIKDGKSFGDAFREMLIGVLNKIVDKTSDITTNLLFNGISSAASSFAQGKNAGGLIKGYSTGGKVTGGSGIRDDVPAMLTDGEYVIKKSSVEAIGKANLDKINYGNDSIAFKLKNEYAYNDPKFPTSGKLDVSSGLSNFGLMDTSISRTNELRLEKEQNLISYLEQRRSYDKNVSDAMRAFRKQKRNRLYGAYFSAAAGVAGAGLSSAFGPAAGSGAGAAGKSYSFNSGATGNNISSTPISSGFGYNMPPTQGGINIGRANGGLIQRFAAGGHVFGGNSLTDTVPAMLTGGEYVIKKNKVNKFGKNFFDNLNNSSVRKYADGGLVSPAFMPANTNKGMNTDLTLQFSSLTNAINNLSNSIQPNTNKDNYGINNYITVSVSVDSQNGVTTESSVNSQSKGNARNDNDQNQVEKLKKGLENDMGAFINKQMKQGGTIYTFVNGRIGR